MKVDLLLFSLRSMVIERHVLLLHYSEFTVYYRDSDGRTVNRVKCRAQADPEGNEVLKELLR